MQTAMKERLQRDFPKDPEFGFLPCQWAVRTSMDELRNTTVLDDALQELGDEFREKLAFDLGATEDQVEQHFRQKGEQLDRDSVTRAYTIVEMNIDHAYMREYPLKYPQDPAEWAREFLLALEEISQEYAYNSQVVMTDTLTPLARNESPEGQGALYEVKFYFEYS
ncbi:MAG: hypothetical protein WAU07_00210 [Microgenomates group bacterium]